MSKKNIRIMTKAGDSGMTTLADGRRVSKSSLRIEAIGNVDELNSLIGLLLSQKLSKEMETELIAIQNDLFDIGAELAGVTWKLMDEKQVFRLESQAEKSAANLLPIQEFILPGGTQTGAFLHYVRAVCRRAERSVFALGEIEEIPETIGKYFNRLSDLLFIYARAVNREAGIVEHLWRK